MERTQYDRSLRHTACSPSHIAPEQGSSSSSSATVGDTTPRHRLEQKRLHSSSTNSSSRTPNGPRASIGDGDKATAQHISTGLLPRRTTTASPAFSQPADPVVQTNNRLTEDYSRRIHCYILQAENDDTASGEHAPPPLLPSMEASGQTQDIPFWRPPRVLQREPHYNYLSTAPAPTTNAYSSPLRRQQDRTQQAALGGQHPRYQRTGPQPSKHSAEAGPFALSPALLAISNSHYNQQLQQEKRQGSSLRQHCQSVPQHSANRPSKPTIQSLLSSTASPPALQLESSSSSSGVSASVAHSPCDTSAGTQPSDSDYDGCSNDAGQGNAGMANSERCLPGPEMAPPHGRPGLMLPPIDARHTRAYHAHDQELPQGLSCIDSSRETMSIASLVGAPASGDSCAQRTSQQVCLPGISSLESHYSPEVSYRQRPLYSSEQRVSSAMTLQPAGSVDLAESTRQADALPSLPQKRLHGETSAAIALQKMARTETQSFACARPTTDNAATATVAPATPKSNLGKRIAVSSLRTLQQYPLCPSNQVLITCYHASVAQKSYGGEKRFLCPPPAVLMYGEGFSARIAHHSPMLLSVITDTAAAGKAGAPTPQLQGASSQDSGSPGGSSDSARPSTSAHAPLECQTSFNERNVALFKSLHVTGMQKAKSFRLRLDLMTPPAIGGQLGGHDHGMWQGPTAYASLESDAVAIISKPSKKTAKARNQSSCIREGSLISLFNRINSQTFRTKYLNVEHNTNRWIAQSHNWSPLEVVVVAAKGAGATRQPGAANPLYYGSVIVLVESRRNFRSPPMIIHKVERGRLVENACSPVSQMQKIALQAKPTAPGAAPRYLKADVGHYSPASSDASSPARFDDPDGSPELTFEPLDSARLSRARTREQPAENGVELDDAFCWTIVGISGFTYAYTMPAEQPPRDCRISPIPRVTEASLSADRTLSLSIVQFDTSCMRLYLNGHPLKVDPYVMAKASSSISAAAAAAAAANRLGAADRFTAVLPADAEPGALCVRRDDGVQYHTKWAVQRKAQSTALELVTCNLDI